MKLTVKQAFERAVLYHQSGKLDDAKLLYQAILHTQPDLPEVNYNLAILDDAKGNLKSAIRLFHKALEDQPKSYQYLSALIDALLKDQQFALANTTLLKALKDGIPKSMIDSLKLKLDAEIKKYNELSLQSPPSESITQLIKYYQEGQFDLAESLGRALTLEYPMHPLALQVLGIILKESGRSLDALNYVKRLAELSPNDAQAHNNLGVILQDVGELREAKASYERAIDINPNYAEAYNNLGSVFHAAGKLSQAEQMYKKAISLNSENAAYYCNLGNTFKESGQLLKAKSNYRQSINLDASLVEAFLKLSRLPSEVMDLETVALLENSSIFHDRLNLDAATQHFFRANVFKHRGDLDASFDELCKANHLKWESVREQAEIEHAEQTDSLDRIKHWHPKNRVVTNDQLVKLIIVGPSRSGKSLLERLIVESSQVKPLYETFSKSYAPKSGSNNGIDVGKLFEDLYLENEVDLLTKGYKAVTTTNPGQVFYADYLLDNLVNSYFLIISRDERDNVAEIFAMDYTNGNSYSYSQNSIKRYLAIYSAICDELYKKAPAQCIRLSFQDLVSKPKQTLSGVADFLQNVLEFDYDSMQTIEIKRKSIFREYI
jgi:Flp pilus assembly protein TadD